VFDGQASGLDHRKRRLPLNFREGLNVLASLYFHPRCFVRAWQITAAEDRKTPVILPVAWLDVSQDLVVPK